MEYKQWYMRAWRRWKDFSGRARRKEYWTFVIINTVFTFLLQTGVQYFTDETGYTFGIGHVLNIIAWLFSLFILIPGLAVSYRRMHDRGKSGWWLLLYIIPLIGWLILVIMFVQDSQPGPNRYGPNPKNI
ncbi:MAG: DUF805 domain-containing protein [Planctomycetes bacterium]|nr:DUF805 domain-containing protein [Planctomycetota bacterium]